MNLQNKPDLIKSIKQAEDTTDQFNYVEVYQDGSWDIMPCSTYTNTCIVREKISWFLGGDCETTTENVDYNIYVVENILSNQ